MSEPPNSPRRSPRTNRKISRPPRDNRELIHADLPPRTPSPGSAPLRRVSQSSDDPDITLRRSPRLQAKRLAEQKPSTHAHSAPLGLNISLPNKLQLPPNHGAFEPGFPGNPEHPRSELSHVDQSESVLDTPIHLQLPNESVIDATRQRQYVEEVTPHLTLDFSSAQRSQEPIGSSPRSNLRQEPPHVISSPWSPLRTPYTNPATPRVVPRSIESEPRADSRYDSDLESVIGQSPLRSIRAFHSPARQARAKEASGSTVSPSQALGLSPLREDQTRLPAPRLTNIPSMASPSRSRISAAILSPIGVTPVKSLYEIASSPLQPSVAAQIEANSADELFQKLGIKFPVIELQTAEVRPGSLLEDEIAHMIGKGKSIARQLSSIDMVIPDTADMRRKLPAFKAQLEDNALKRSLRAQLALAQQLRVLEQNELKSLRDQALKLDLLATRERNLTWQLEERRRTLDERPRTATQVSTVKERLDQRKAELQSLEKEVFRAGQGLQRTIDENRILVQQSAARLERSHSSLSAERASLHRLRSETKRHLEELGLVGLSRTLKGFVLHHHYLNILVEHGPKQTFQLASHSRVLKHYVRRLDAQKSLTSNILEWTKILEVYRQLRQLRRQGQHSWHAEATDLVLNQKTKSGLVKVVLGDGDPEVSATFSPAKDLTSILLLFQKSIPGL